MKKKKFDITILSPHLDDAALSLGEHILDWKKQGKSIQIVNCFSSFGKITFKKLPEYTQRYVQQSGCTNTQVFETKRKIEDKNAMAEMRTYATYVHLVDGGFRKTALNKYVYPEQSKLFSGSISNQDYKTLEKLISELKKIVFFSDSLYIPFGIGNHADHLLARLASVSLSSRHKYSYIDMPYSLYKENWSREKIFSFMNRICSVKFSSQQKWHILRNYSSQLPILFKNKPYFFPEITLYER